MACPPRLVTHYDRHLSALASHSSRIDFAIAGHASSNRPAASARCGTRRSPRILSVFSSGRDNLNSRVQVMSTTQGDATILKDTSKPKIEPDHLLVLVHGILASPSDWTYAEAELKRQLGSNFLIYVSSSNTFTKTFDGIDGGGRRLADEVVNVVQQRGSLTRISFLAHSLGGLFARYAVALLYTPEISNGKDGNLFSSKNAEKERSEYTSMGGKIAGLDPVNFITLATPHLGVRGRKQLPFLLGVPVFEKLAPFVAPVIVGRTGRQLFLTDGKSHKPPLLLRMALDFEDKKFISALAAFKCRILYANVSYDHMVGWRTSSIRRETELVKPPRRSLVGYKHVIDVEYCPPVSSGSPKFPPEAAKAKEAAKNEPNPQNTAEYHDIIEEEMIRGLQRVGWKKVDVSFHSTLWPFFAHNNIHVKSEWFHNAGAGVIAHVADSIKQQEQQLRIAANL